MVHEVRLNSWLQALACLKSVQNSMGCRDDPHRGDPVRGLRKHAFVRAFAARAGPYRCVMRYPAFVRLVRRRIVSIGPFFWEYALSCDYSIARRHRVPDNA